MRVSPRACLRAPISFLIVVAFAVFDPLAIAAGGLDPARLAALRSVTEAQVTPDGSRVAYVLSVPRRPGVDEDGEAWRELHVVSVGDGADRAWVHGDVSVSEVQLAPDGKHLFYLAKRGEDKHRSLWSIPIDGGESRKVTSPDEDISSFRVAPDGKRVAFVAKPAQSREVKKAKEKGYEQEIFEEDWRQAKLWIAEVDGGAKPVDPSAEKPEEKPEPRELPLEGSAFEVDWSPDGTALAVTVAPTPLIDDRYMARRVWIVDAATGEVRLRLQNPGKLGKFRFSPDGRRLAMISAADPNDPAEGRLLVASTATGELRDTVPDLLGHVQDIEWRDAMTVMYVVDAGVESELGEVDVVSLKRRRHLTSAEGAPLLSSLSLSRDGRSAAFVAERPTHPPEVYAWVQDSGDARRLTDSNPWLADVGLARQEVFRWQARDGLSLEGVLVHPLASEPDRAAPLLLMVHGGPESHVRHGWVTSYSQPGQLAAASGFSVLYPNYRGSTGRGVAFSKTSQGDAAGKEFDDLIDAVDALGEAGRVDRDRVGITGGSYGGYATAWCSTKHTAHFRAGVMLVGISNTLTKGLTTEIPVEDRMVHTLADPWKEWQHGLERSPIYYAAQSRTALLIAGGAKDSRVDPSQSLQLYRALKLIGKTPVRYVRYPDERHGNRKAAARDDYTRRLMRWMEHFVKERKTDLPPWELELPQLAQDDEDEKDEVEGDSP